jgi:hypothetical protein
MELQPNYPDIRKYPKFSPKRQIYAEYLRENKPSLQIRLLLKEMAKNIQNEQDKVFVKLCRKESIWDT